MWYLISTINYRLIDRESETLADLPNKYQCHQSMYMNSSTDTIRFVSLVLVLFSLRNLHCRTYWRPNCIFASSLIPTLHYNAKSLFYLLLFMFFFIFSSCITLYLFLSIFLHEQRFCF